MITLQLTNHEVLVICMALDVFETRANKTIESVLSIIEKIEKARKEEK